MGGEEDWLLEDDEKENGENGKVDAEANLVGKGKGIGRGGLLGSGSKKEFASSTFNAIRQIHGGVYVGFGSSR